MSIKTLVINPGSTSTKVGVFEDETLLFEETLRHPTEEIAKYASVIDQKDFPKGDRSRLCERKGLRSQDPQRHRGPRRSARKTHPRRHLCRQRCPAADLKAGVQGQHASNLGGVLRPRDR